MSDGLPDIDHNLTRQRGAVAVIVRGARLLVIRRSQTVVAPRAYCFPGGGILAGESEQAALCRELQEELHVMVRPLERLWQSVTPWNVELAWWRAELPLEQAPRPNPAEVESVHWLTPGEMAELPDLLESNRHFLQQIDSGAIGLTSNPVNGGRKSPLE